MRRLLTSALAIAFFLPNLLAGDLTLTMATTGRGNEGRQTHLWSSKYMRINHSEGQRDTLVDFGQGIHYTIDHKKKVIQKMSWEDLEAGLEGMAERMKNLPAFAQKLVLYTASNEEIEKAVMGAFAKAHPEIKVEAINMSTGPVVQRAIAEKATNASCASSTPSVSWAPAPPPC